MNILMWLNIRIWTNIHLYFQPHLSNSVFAVYKHAFVRKLQPTGLYCLPNVLQMINF